MTQPGKTNAGASDGGNLPCTSGLAPLSGGQVGQMPSTSRRAPLSGGQLGQIMNISNRQSLPIAQEHMRLFNYSKGKNRAGHSKGKHPAKRIQTCRVSPNPYTSHYI